MGLRAVNVVASLAQQESESLSLNVKLGIQYRNQKGKVQVNHNRFLGYTKDEDGKLVIVQEEAEIVRRIYTEYLEGKSLLTIRRGLETDGIRNGAGNLRWHESNLKQILTNVHAHEYDNIDRRKMWNTLTRDIPELIIKLQGLI